MNRLNSSHKLGIIYFVFGIIYIFLSDYLALKIAGDDFERYYRFQNYKGVIFFLVSSLLVYFVSKKLYANIEKANRAQKETLLRYNSIFQATNEAIWDLNMETNECYTSRSLCETFGFSKGDVKDGYTWWMEHIHSQDKERVLNRMNRDILEGKVIWQDEYHFICGNNDVKTIYERGIILRDEAGIPYRIISSMQDVTEQRNLQKSLTEEKIKHRNEMAKGIINAQEQERRRIGVELHDNVNQLLGVVKLYIENALSDPQSKDELLKKSSQYLVDVIREVRKLSKSLSPPVLVDIGLIDSIYDMAENIEETKNIEVEVDCTDFNEENIPEEKKFMIFRILQEQLKNVTDHSHADKLMIQLKLLGDTVNLIVEDNGRGFETHDIIVGRGLQDIKNRLELFNGNMEIISAPGNGCRIEVEI